MMPAGDKYLLERIDPDRWKDRRMGSLSTRTISQWFGVALVFWAIAAIFGTILRYLFIEEVPFLDYRYILHAHSHVAMLGWAFMAVSAIFLYTFLKGRAGGVYNRIFILNTISAIGMSVAFPLQGYGPVSIFFSTLHVIAAYWFAWRFITDISSSTHYSNNNGILFAKWAVIWMVISTAGLLAIAPVTVAFGKIHPLYFASIQFFLHFQFNGWFTYAIIALLLHWANKDHRRIKVGAPVFILLQVSLLLTYTLSVTWSTPEDFLFYLNSAGVIFQLIAIGIILSKVFIAFRSRLFSNGLPGTLLLFGLLSLGVKIVVQTAVAHPAIAEISYTIRNFVVGFIHLVMLGSISLTLLSVVLNQSLLPRSLWSKAGCFLVLVGFVSTEVILFGQGLLLWMRKGFVENYYEIVFGATVLLPVGIVLLCISSVIDTYYRNSLERI